MTWETCAGDSWKYPQAAWTTKTGKTKHFLPRGLWQPLKGAFMTFFWVTTPKILWVLFVQRGASSASWKQSRELSSSGQWGLAERWLSPGERGARRERARLPNCSRACCGWGLALQKGKGLFAAQKQSCGSPLQLSWELEWFFGCWGMIMARKALCKTGTKRCSVWGRCMKIPAITHCLIFCLEGSESNFGIYPAYSPPDLLRAWSPPAVKTGENP